MTLIDLEISVASLHTLQQAGIWDVEDVVTMMSTHPSIVTTALAKIKDSDFEEITKAIKKLTLKT